MYYVLNNIKYWYSDSYYISYFACITTAMFLVACEIFLPTLAIIIIIIVKIVSVVICIGIKSAAICVAAVGVNFLGFFFL